MEMFVSKVYVSICSAMKTAIYLFLLSFFVYSIPTTAQNCSANFGLDRKYYNNASFIDSSSSKGTITSMTWDFGDGTIYTPRRGTQKYLSHQYASGGTYTVCLSIIDDLNCKDTICKTITVSGITSPTCMPAFSYKVDSLNTVQFTNLTGPDSNYSYRWAIRDSTYIIDTNKNPTHTYSRPGGYTVFLTAFNNNTGDSCMMRDTIFVNTGCTPIIAFSMGNNDSVYFYTWTVHRTFQYTWDFGDGSPRVNWERGWHQFPSTKTYAVSLTIYDSINNCTGTTTDSIFLGAASQQCKAKFIVEKDTSTFGVTLYNHSPHLTQNSYLWDFGDGSTIYSRTPKYTYANFGTYEVCLTVENWGYRCRATYCDTIKIDSLGSLSIEVEDGLLVGIEEREAVLDNLNIYPNPAQLEVKIDLSNVKTPLNIKLIDMSGRTLIEKENLPGGTIESLDLNAFKNGIYFIIINDGTNQSVKKLIVAN